LTIAFILCRGRTQFPPQELLSTPSVSRVCVVR
jgi:hypothetical protein